MQGSKRVIEALNDLLTIELTAINQYFVHSRMCESWGYERLAHRFRETALEEMRDAEAIIDRILFLEGVPNMQRLGPITVGETVAEQLRLHLETEQRAIKQLSDGVAVSLDEGDTASREFFAASLPGEEQHVDWLETQLTLIRQVGEANYLAQQLHD